MDEDEEACIFPTASNCGVKELETDPIASCVNRSSDKVVNNKSSRLVEMETALLEETREMEAVNPTGTSSLNYKMTFKRLLCRICSPTQACRWHNINRIKDISSRLVNHSIRPKVTGKKSLTSRKMSILCEHCGKNVVHRRNMSSHKKWNCPYRLASNPPKADGIFQCDLCPRNFINKGSLNRHLIGVHEKKQHKCKICSKEFLLASALYNHTKQRHMDLNLKCDKCQCDFIDRNRLLRHKLRCSVVELPTPYSEKGPIELEQECQTFQPKLETTTISSSDHHESMSTSDPLLPPYGTEDDLHRHTPTVHNNMGITHKCKSCDLVFLNKNQLKNHRKQCAKKFTRTPPPEKHREPVADVQSRSSSVEHSNIIREKINESTTTCHVCHMKCLSTISLRNHIRFFHNSLPSMVRGQISSSKIPNKSFAPQQRASSFECHICHERFNQSEQLRHHLPIAHSNHRTEIKPERLTEIKQDNNYSDDNDLFLSL